MTLRISAVAASRSWLSLSRAARSLPRFKPGRALFTFRVSRVAVLIEWARTPSLRVTSIFERKAGDRLGKALQLEWANGLELEDPIERGHGLPVGEDLAAL